MVPMQGPVLKREPHKIEFLGTECLFFWVAGVKAKNESDMSVIGQRTVLGILYSYLLYIYQDPLGNAIIILDIIHGFLRVDVS
jgi:hypothetical protein